MNMLQNCYTIDLTAQAYYYAQKFAAEQENESIAKKVYYNTLAVYTVHEFLSDNNIETDLLSSESWHPAIRGFKDVADLVIPNLGVIECCTIFEADQAIIIPPLAKDDRLLYVGVRFNQALTEAELLGFISLVDGEESLSISLSRLLEIEDLPNYLFKLELENELLSSAVDQESISSSVVLSDPIIIPILDWFKKGFTDIIEGIKWQFIGFEAPLAHPRGAKSKGGENLSEYNGQMTRNLEIAGQPYQLKIIPSSQADQEDIIWKFQLINVTPGGLIPGGFKLRLLTENGENFEGNEDLAKEAVEMLQIEVSLEEGEGLIWEIEPLPEGYTREILRF